jgi:putative ABC transport system substrate-binding protein
MRSCAGGGRGGAGGGRRAALVFAASVAFGARGAEPKVPPARVARIGVLTLFPPPTPQQPDPVELGFLRGLRELGYVEGETLVVERRWANGRSDRLAQMAAELVRLKVDLIIAGGQPAREAARKATSTIPILTLSGGDPVREGWAQSLARPGGNVTGLTFTFPELGPKRLELLKEAAPALRSVVVLIDPNEVVDAGDVIREATTGAERLGMQPHVVEMHGADGLASAFAAVRRHRPQALFPIAMYPHRGRIAALAARERLPTVGESSEEARAGFLLAYGVDIDDLARRGVVMLDKMLRGERAGDMPIERPAKFRLSVNQKTARAIGVTVPKSLLMRADEVIE